MLQIAAIKQEYNVFDHFNIMLKIEYYKLNKLIKEFSRNSVLIKEGKYNTTIIHRSSKKENCYQASIFCNNAAIGDITRSNIKDIIKEVYALHLID